MRIHRQRPELADRRNLIFVEMHYVRAAANERFAVLVHEAFQQFRLLNQVGITLAVGVEFMIQKGRERIEGIKIRRSRPFHQWKKLFFGNDLG